MRLHKYLIAMMVSSLTLTAYASSEMPLADSVTLSQLVETAQQHTKQTAMKAEFDDGLWEITTCKDDDCHKLYMRPTDGKVLRESLKINFSHIPDKNTIELADMVKKFENNDKGQIIKIKYKTSHNGYWEVKYWNGSKKVKLKLDKHGDRKD